MARESGRSQPRQVGPTDQDVDQLAPEDRQGVRQGTQEEMKRVADLVDPAQGFEEHVPTGDELADDDGYLEPGREEG